MSKCKKVKNPCKICLATVTQKTGLQCQGACECWVHYSCLNYTPGKIKDIKAGIIKVTCPCPDCKSTSPKEVRTDEPFSCSNLQCPAHKPPKCENTGCPINDGADTNKMNQTSDDNAAWPLSQCGTECKKHTNPNTPDSPGVPRLDRRIPQHHGASPAYQRQPSPNPGFHNCPSACSSTNDIPGDYSHDPMAGLPSLGALEQMCNTVGQLTNQINCLMNKMKEAVERGGVYGAGHRKGGQKGICPKPCYCPSNPAKRM